MKGKNVIAHKPFLQFIKVFNQSIKSPKCEENLNCRLITSSVLITRFKQSVKLLTFFVCNFENYFKIYFNRQLLMIFNGLQFTKLWLLSLWTAMLIYCSVNNARARFRSGKHLIAVPF
jgi:hypothetical protein